MYFHLDHMRSLIEDAWHSISRAHDHTDICLSFPNRLAHNLKKSSKCTCSCKLQVSAKLYELPTWANTDYTFQLIRYADAHINNVNVSRANKIKVMSHSNLDVQGKNSTTIYVPLSWFLLLIHAMIYKLVGNSVSAFRYVKPWGAASMLFRVQLKLFTGYSIQQRANQEGKRCQSHF